MEGAVKDVDVEEEEADSLLQSRNSIVAEGNVLAAATIFSASIVLDALNAVPTTLAVDVPVSLRTTALVLIALVASPAVRSEYLFEQRGLAYVLLVLTAWVGLHQGNLNDVI